MAKLSVFICSLYVLVLTSYSMAMTDEQRTTIRNHFVEVGAGCLKDNPINEDDITALNAMQAPSGPGVPCFLACVMKAVGIMDSNGMLQKESALELAKKVFNDTEEIKAIEDYLHSCSHVNTEPVSDGDKGCERAMLSHKCMAANAAQTRRRRNLTVDINIKKA